MLGEIVIQPHPGRPYQVDGNQLNIGASVGIAVASEGDSKLEDLLKRADLAMYCAKAEGRGTYRFFEAQMDETAQARRDMELLHDRPSRTLLRFITSR